MTQLHDLRLRLLVQQESEAIAHAHPDELDLSVVQARCLCWLALLADAHEEQAICRPHPTPARPVISRFSARGQRCVVTHPGIQPFPG
jgi:hypothetical protein